MKPFLLSIFLLSSTFLFCQPIMVPQDDNGISPWVPKLQIEWEGGYRFGDSESESQLWVFFTSESDLPQMVIEKGHWEERGEQFGWVITYEVLTNLKVLETGQFTSDQIQGMFSTYQNHHGIVVEDSWTEVGREFGRKNTLIDGEYRELLQTYYENVGVKQE